MGGFERNPEYGRLRRLIDGHQAAMYALPPEIMGAWAAAERMDEERRRVVPEQVPPARDRLVAALLEAADGGTGAFPDGHELLDAELADRAAALRAVPVGRATTIAQGRVVGLVVDQAAELVAGPLRDAHGEVLAQLDKAVEVLADYEDLNADALLRAPKAQRDCYLGLEQCVARYHSVREARADLVGAMSNQQAERVFGEMKNGMDIWPGLQPAIGRTSEPPWPQDSKRRLIWLVRAGAELWLPTRDEVTARYEEYFAEGITQMRRQGQHRAAVSAWGG